MSMISHTTSMTPLPGSDDLGRTPEELQKEFPRFWYCPPLVDPDEEVERYAHDDPLKWRTVFSKARFEEPHHVFAPRALAFKEWLAKRPESSTSHHHPWVEKVECND